MTHLERPAKLQLRALWPLALGCLLISACGGDDEGDDKGDEMLIMDEPASDDDSSGNTSSDSDTDSSDSSSSDDTTSDDTTTSEPKPDTTSDAGTTTTEPSGADGVVPLGGLCANTSNCSQEDGKAVCCGNTCTLEADCNLNGDGFLPCNSKDDCGNKICCELKSGDDVMRFCTKPSACQGGEQLP